MGKVLELRPGIQTLMEEKPEQLNILAGTVFWFRGFSLLRLSPRIDYRERTKRKIEADHLGGVEARHPVPEASIFLYAVFS